MDSDLVTVLEQADIRGRICADLDKQLEVLELFGLAAREHGTWKADPYEEWAACFEQAIEDPGQVDYVYREAQLLFEEGVIQSPEEALGKTYVHRSEHPEVVLTCGPAGVGKSTWIQRELPEYEVISLDALREELTGTCRRGNKKAEGRMMQEALERFRAVLRRKGKVVWDATSLWRDSRARLVRLGRDYHAFTRIVVFPVPESEALRRNRGRPNAVPKEVIQNHYQGWEWPEPWEAHHVDVVDEY